MPTGVHFFQQLGEYQVLDFDDTGVDEVDELLLKGLHPPVVSGGRAYRKSVVGWLVLPDPTSGMPTPG